MCHGVSPGEARTSPSTTTQSGPDSLEHDAPLAIGSNAPSREDAAARRGQPSHAKTAMSCDANAICRRYANKGVCRKVGSFLVHVGWILFALTLPSPVTAFGELREVVQCGIWCATVLGSGSCR